VSSRILFCVTGSNAWYGKLLQWAMRTNVNHSFILYESKEWGGWWAVEINEHGVRKLPVEKLDRINYIECYECKNDLWPALRTITDFVGAKYDWRGLLWGLFKLIVFRLFGKTILKPVHRHHRLFCSEGVGRVMKAGKLPGAGDVEGLGPIPDTEKWKPPEVSPLYLQVYWKASEYFFRTDTPPGVPVEK